MKIKWYKVTKKYNNVPYKKDSWDIEEGLDNFSLFILFLEDIGHDVSKYKNESYEGPDLINFIKTKFKKTNDLKKGCICIMDGKNKDPNYPMIFLGRNLFLFSHPSVGCRIIKHPVLNIQEIYN